MPESSNPLRKRLRLNVLSYGYAQIATLLFQILLVPFFLRYWGTDRYADWIVLTGAITLLSVLDFGVTQATANKVTMLAGAKEWEQVRCGLQTSLAFSLALGALIFLAVCLSCQFVDWHSVLKVKSMGPGDASTVMSLMSVYLGVQLVGGPLDAWFRAIDRTPQGAILSASRRLLDIGVTIVILMMGRGAVALAAAMTIAQMAYLVLFAAIGRHYSDIPVLGLASASWKEFRSVLRPSAAYLSFSLSQAITLQGGIQILNQMTQSSVLVGFSMSRTLMRLIIQVGVVVNNALKPEVSRLTGMGLLQQAAQTTRKASFYAASIACVAYVAAIVVGPLVVDWWSGGKVEVSHSSLALVGAHAVLNVLWFVPAAMLIAVNRHVNIASIYLSASLITLGGWYLLKADISPLMGASMLLALPELVTLIYFFRSKQTN